VEHAFHGARHGVIEGYYLHFLGRSKFSKVLVVDQFDGEWPIVLYLIYCCRDESFGCTGLPQNRLSKASDSLEVDIDRRSV